MSNPYQPFFDKLDETVAELVGKHEPSLLEENAADLLRRAGFVLANLLAVNAQVLPTLVLETSSETAETQEPSHE